MSEERRHLTEEYHAAVADATRTSRQLADWMTTSSQADFILLLNEKNRAIARVRRARIAYLKRIIWHADDEGEDVVTAPPAVDPSVV